MLRMVRDMVIGGVLGLAALFFLGVDLPTPSLIGYFSGSEPQTAEQVYEAERASPPPPGATFQCLGFKGKRVCRKAPEWIWEEVPHPDQKSNWVDFDHIRI